MFAWAGFVGLGLLIGDSGIGPVGVLDWLFVLTLFLLVPIGLVLAWSFLLQGRPPTGRQLRAGATLVLVLAAVVGLFALWATLYNLSDPSRTCGLAHGQAAEGIEGALMATAMAECSRKKQGRVLAPAAGDDRHAA